MTDINAHPVTVRADHDGIQICGLTESTRGADAEAFTLDLFNHAEAVMLLAHLRRAQDDIDDVDPIGGLSVGGRLVGRPWIMARVALHWTSDQPPVATATVVLSGEVYGDSRFLRLTLDVDAVTQLCADIEAAVSQVPHESRFHVWDDMPGRAFDPHGCRDWVFEEYAQRAASV